MMTVNRLLSSKLAILVVLLIVGIYLHANLGNLVVDITANTTLNTTMATQIVNWLNAGLSVWTILGMVVTGNLISVGLLFTVKALLGKLTSAVVIAW